MRPRRRSPKSPPGPPRSHRRAAASSSHIPAKAKAAAPRRAEPGDPAARVRLETAFPGERRPGVGIPEERRRSARRAVETNHVFQIEGRQRIPVQHQQGAAPRSRRPEPLERPRQASPKSRAASFRASGGSGADSLPARRPGGAVRCSPGQWWRFTMTSRIPEAASQERTRVSRGTPRKSSAGFARFPVSAPRRSPRPAANTIARRGGATAAGGAAAINGPWKMSPEPRGIPVVEHSGFPPREPRRPGAGPLPRAASSTGGQAWTPDRDSPAGAVSADQVADLVVFELRRDQVGDSGFLPWSPRRGVRRPPS